jgi:putative PIN family toxin of toxin-antitoxin system
VVAVFDTNVVYSGLRSSLGASFGLIQAVRKGQLRPAVTAPLVFEYEDVLRRPGYLPNLQPADISSFLDWWVSVSACHTVHFLWRPFLRDAKDDLVLEAAVAASADCLVTFNVRDFAGTDSLGVRILTPNELINLLPP